MYRMFLLVLTKNYKNKAGHWWLTPVILATLEAEILRIAVRSHPQANMSCNPISKKCITKKG
jgi:hypothetical protein